MQIFQILTYFIIQYFLITFVKTSPILWGKSLSSGKLSSLTLAKSSFPEFCFLFDHVNVIIGNKYFQCFSLKLQLPSLISEVMSARQRFMWKSGAVRRGASSAWNSNNYTSLLPQDNHVLQYRTDVLYAHLPVRHILLKRSVLKGQDLIKSMFFIFSTWILLSETVFHCKEAVKNTVTLVYNLVLLL